MRDHILVTKTLVTLLLLSTYALAQGPETEAATPTPTVTALTYDNGQPFVDGSEMIANQTYTVTANTASTQSVVIVRDGVKQKTDSTAPFDYRWTPNVIGSHTLSFTPFSAANGAGTAGQPYLVNFNVVTSASPTPSPTPSPQPTPTPSTPTPTPRPTVTPTPTPTPATPTPTPSPSPSVPLVTVTVYWDATSGDHYDIYFSKDIASGYAQIEGGTAAQDGIMQATVSGLDQNTIYYFSDTVTRNGIVSDKLPPITYTTGSAANQSLKIQTP
jgi:hypothetical protein